jgi:NADH-quinone oxidoreductase E subunit
MSSHFEFNPQNQKTFESILQKYPNKRAAMLPTLHLAQQQEGFITPEVEEAVAQLLDVPIVDVREVTSFYSLFSQKPLGRHHIRVCTSLSCWIRGCDGVGQHLRDRLGVEGGGVTPDGEFSWEPIPDCLGACELAPMMQLDGYFEGNLTPERIDEILDKTRNSKPVKK